MDNNLIKTTHKKLKKITHSLHVFSKKCLLLITGFPSKLYSDIKNIDENNLEQFKSIVKRVASILISAWLLILLIGILFNWGDEDGNVGIVGDAMNIITSLTGVFTVALLAYAVYLQKKELNEVRIQILEQTESTEKEQKINRTLNYLEEWEGIWNVYQKSENEYLLDNGDLSVIYPDVFNFIENLIYKNKINEIRDKYIDIPLLVKAIKISSLIQEIDKTSQYIEDQIKCLENPIPSNSSYSGTVSTKEIISKETIDKYKNSMKALNCYKTFINSTINSKKAT